MSEVELDANSELGDDELDGDAPDAADALASSPDSTDAEGSDTGDDDSDRSDGDDDAAAETADSAAAAFAANVADLRRAGRAVTGVETVVVVPPDQHATSRNISRPELVLLLVTRARQIERGGAAFVPAEKTPALTALAELQARRFPLMLERSLDAAGGVRRVEQISPNDPAIVFPRVSPEDLRFGPDNGPGFALA